MRVFLFFMRSFLWSAFSLLIFWTSPVSSAVLPEKLNLRQFIQTEAAYRVAESPALTKLLNFYQIEARYDVSRKIVLTAVGRVAYDAVYDLKDLKDTPSGASPTG